jgi:hypothetical protein
MALDASRPFERFPGTPLLFRFLQDGRAVSRKGRLLPGLKAEPSLGLRVSRLLQSRMGRLK